MLVKWRMSKYPLTIGPEESLSDAHKYMNEQNVTIQWISIGNLWRYLGIFFDFLYYLNLSPLCAGI